MNWLPIVGRELRVAARKPSTAWFRVAAALIVLIVGGGCWLISAVQRGSTAELGSILFYVLTWMCLAAALAAGLFLTSDCLSEEKREGTLGLLFLTDLRGYDVVLGKLLATSLRGFYALLAVLPILAITELMGGVTGAQYWKSALALVNGLFFSLALGMLVSALSQDSQKALASTLFLLIVVAAGGPLADLLIGAAKGRGFTPLWSISSPAYVLAAATAWGRSPYWTALGLTQVAAWSMLALGCAVVPQTWQERRKISGDAHRSWTYVWKHGGLRRRRRLRLRLLERQPVAWLVCRERWQAHTLGVIAFFFTAGVVFALMRSAREAWILWNSLGGLFTLVLYLWAASQACRFFVEARRSGLLELLLVSPVDGRNIVGEHWRAWLRMFGWSVLLLLSVQMMAAALSQMSYHRVAAQTSAMAASAATNQSTTFSNQTTVMVSTTVSLGGGTNAVPQRSFSVSLAAQRASGVAAAATGLTTVANLLAICWFGMWMGLVSRTANLATLKTILFVQVLPWFVIAFGVNIILGIVMTRWIATSSSPQPATWFLWWPLLSTLLSAGAAVAKDIGFIVWSRNKLRTSLRQQAAAIVGKIPLPGRLVSRV